MATSKNASKKTAAAKISPLLTASPEEVGKRVDTILALVLQMEIALGSLVENSDDERKFSNGRFRDGESAAITGILDAADAFPSLFVALAEKDNGSDDTVFESQPTRDNLARRDHLARLAGALDPLTRGVSDTLLALGSSVREVATPAYAIARVAASVHPKLRAKLSKPTKYYGAAAEKAKQTKKTKKANG